MKKITLIILTSLLSFCGYAQLPPEDFEGSWAPIDGDTDPVTATDWFYLQENGPGYHWAQQVHVDGVFPSFEGLPGTHTAYIQRETVDVGEVAIDYLVTPEFNLPAGAELRFQSRLTVAGDQGGTYKIMVFPADGGDPTVISNYDLVQQWTELEINPEQFQYTEKIVTIGAEYANTDIRIAFVMEGNFDDRWLIDDVKVVEPCVEPTNLTADEFTLDSAELSWDNPGGATSWEIEIVLDSSTPTGYGVVYSDPLPYVAESTATGNPLVQNPLTENTNYKYYVKAICEDGGESDWVGPFFFSTVSLGETCADPIVIPNSTPLAYSDTDNTGNFADTNYEGNPGASGCGSTNFYLNGNDVVYSFTPDFTGTISIDITGNGTYAGVFVYTSCANIGVNCEAGAVTGNVANPLSIPSFAVTEDTTYYIVISTWATPQTTPYTLTLQQVFCAPPVGLATTAGMTDAELSWTNPSGATEWQVVVQDPGDGIPTAPGTSAATNTDFLVTAEFDGTPLVASTQYEYYVRANCGDGNYSAWAGPYPFNTTICTLEDQCVWEFEMWDTFGDSWNGNTMTVSQNGITIATLTGPLDADNQTHIFVSVPVCHDMPIELFWNAGGNWAGEVGVSIINSFDQNIYTKAPGTGAQNTSLYTDVVDCLVPKCLPVTGLTATDILPTSAMLGWAGAATGEWDVYVVLDGDPAPTDATVGEDATTNPHLVEGLDADTDYDFYVRMNCETGEDSDWSAPFSFTTLPTCPQPLNLTVSNIGDTEADINWVEANTATEWQVYIVENGGAAPTDATVGETATDIPFTTTTLEEGTIYQVWVKAVCGDDDHSQWTGPVTFNTTICDPSEQCAFEFEMWDSFGDSWNGNTMTVSQNGITIATLTGPLNEDDQTHIFQTVMLCHDEPFQLYWNAGGNWATEVGVSIINSHDQNIYTKAPGTGAQNSSLFIGTVDCENPDCLDPTALTATNITIDTADLGWTAPASTAWEVYVVPTGDPAPTEDTVGVEADTNPFTYDQEPLVPDTTFDYYVRVVCGPDDYSDWAGPFTFTTLPTCPRPIDLTVTDISNTSVMLHWTETGAATAWEVYVVEAGTEAPVAGTEGVDADTNPFVYEPLEAGLEYEFYVRAVCAEDDKSKWEGPFAFYSAICPLEEQCAYEFDMWDSFGDGWNNNTMTVFQNGIPVATLVGPTNADDLNHVYQTVNLCSGVPFTLHWNSGGSFAGEVGVAITNVAYDEEVYNKPPGTGAQNSDLYTGIPVCEPITCPQPIDLTSAGFDLTSVILSWTPGGAETQWEVVIQSEGGPYPGETPAESVIVNEPTYHAEGLVEGEFYEYYVRAICGEDDLSFWSGPAGFNIFDPEGCDIEVLVLDNPEIGTILNGSELVLCPEDNNCLDLTAEYLETGDTSDYLIESIDYAPPYPFTGGTPVSVGTDDEWSPEFELPFDFCFYGENYSSVIVGSNGVVSFDVAEADGYCPWAFDQEIPNPGFPILNAIYGVYQDIYPPEDNAILTPDINVQVLGNYPCRALVVNYSDVAQFGSACRTDPDIGGQTTQIVLYEVTNVIEIYVGRRVACTAWDEGAGVLGLQNAAGTLAAVPEGRNTGPWTAIEEAWRFVPDGESNTTFEWLQDGDVLSSETTVNVCVEGETDMTARATYTDCNGDEIVKESNFTIRIADPIEANDPQDLTACSTGEAVTFDLNDALEGMMDDPTLYTFEFYATESGANGIAVEEPLDPEYSTATNTTIWIRIMEEGLPCFITTSFDITLSNVPPVFTMTNDFSICEGTSGTIEVTGGNWTEGEAEFSWTLDGEALPDTTSTITATEGGDYEVTVNVNGCVATDVTTVTAVPVAQVDELEDVAACDSYELQPLTAGNYFTEAGGEGVQLSAGEMITSSQEIFIYAESGTTPNCWTETSFEVTISPSPSVTSPGDQNVCDSYTLPALTSGNYFTGEGGTGDMLEAGDVINTNQQIYVYAETGTDPNCFAQEMFTVTVISTPQVDSLDDVTSCESYTLAALGTGNYYTQSGGAGTMLNAGDVITTSQEVFIYAESETGNCSTESSFTITIASTPELAIEEGCDGNTFMLGIVQAEGADTFNPDNASYEWTGPDGFTSTDREFAVPAAGMYSVIVTSEEGCVGTIEWEVLDTTCEIPRGVSPNNDDKNDNFDLSTLGVRKLSIFNRYGQEVYSRANYTNQWEGQGSNGDELPTGTYFYMIERENGESKTGWVYLNRQE